MRPLVWTAAFTRAFRRVVRKDSTLRARIERTLQRLAEDPFQPALHSHKLKGALNGVWACTVDYEYRILFETAQNRQNRQEEILLLTLGTHDEVY